MFKPMLDGPPTKVLVFGPEAMSCAAVAALVRADARTDAVAITSDIDEMARYARGHRPDVVLVVSWPGDPGELAEQVVAAVGEAAPESRVLVLGRETDADSVRRAIRAGARGYVLIMEGSQALGEALVLAGKGYSYVSPRMGCEIARIPEADPDGLTGREKEILSLIALGHTNSEIAGLMFLSVRTIESHRRAIFEKCSFAARHELVAYALEEGLMGAVVTAGGQASRNATATIA